jgi:aspartyl-tRNA(Asn)/glutamyl-tRNA(Gln) amidotransferase subunit C
MEKEPLINKKTIDYLSELSRIKITEAEKPKLEADLNAILNYVKQLQEVDTSSLNLDEELLKIKTINESGYLNEENLDFENDDLIDGFYQRKDKWLEIPPIF